MTSVNIDGKAIRALREQKDLTQLYLATVVGVTTDTISRWENRKYPSIKLENAEKLAEALGVDIEEILEQQSDEAEIPPDASLTYDDTADQDDDQSAADKKIGLKRFVPLLTAGVLGIAVIAAGLYMYLTGKDPVITAVRTLPLHTASGLAFPVIIRLKADQPINAPILLRDVLTGDAIATARKSATELQHFDKNPRWIGRLIEGEAAFVYMVHPDTASKQDQQITFSGDCVSGTLKKTGRTIEGGNRITITRYHWADRDGDQTITDEEILDAYERYSIPGNMNIDFSEVERLWLAGKYHWDEQQQRIIPDRH